MLTTSRRPSRNTRRLVKALAKLIPGSVKINRGKLTFKLLALQALDLSYDKLIVVRNRKGNPGYLDLYVVRPPGELIKECTLNLCGYNIADSYSKVTNVKRVLLNLVPTLLSDTGVENIDVVLKTRILECIIKMFNVTVVRKDADTKKDARDICMYIVVHTSAKKNRSTKRKLFEIEFTGCSNSEKYLTLSICKYGS
jgi:hypothetical protein